MPSDRMQHVGDYLLANMHRRPPDWLLTEWYKGLTYTSQMSIGGRHKVRRCGALLRGGTALASTLASA